VERLQIGGSAANARSAIESTVDVMNTFEQISRSVVWTIPGT
jgi:hypothetical protein